jgi:hypothetical protein
VIIAGWEALYVALSQRIKVEWGGVPGKEKL